MAMKTYNVHIYPVMRLCVRNIKAESPEDALERAIEAADIPYQDDDFEWACELDNWAIVDPQKLDGTIDYDNVVNFTCKRANDIANLNTKPIGEWVQALYNYKKGQQYVK